MFDRILTLHRDVFNAPYKMVTTADELLHVFYDHNGSEILKVIMPLTNDQIEYTQNNEPVEWDGQKHWIALAKSLKEYTAQYLCSFNTDYIDVVMDRYVIRLMETKRDGDLIHFNDAHGNKYTLHRFQLLKYIPN